jgi:hypothetical protein
MKLNFGAVFLLLAGSLAAAQRPTAPAPPPPSAAPTAFDAHAAERFADRSATSADATKDIPAPEAAERPGRLSLLGTLLFAGLASPFLALQDSFHGIIGLVILFVGIRIAWQKTEEKPLDIIGPFHNAAPTAG